MATLKDIANMCGVSTATVSYVLNNADRQVLPATRERVLKAAAEVGYQPNAYARALKGFRTKVIGVVFPHETVPFLNVYFGPILEGILSVTTDLRMASMLFTGFSWEETEQGAQKLFNGICDGFVLVAPRRDSQFARNLLARKVPLVIVGTSTPEFEAATVDADNRSGGRLATEHLLGLGHRKIAILLAADDPAQSRILDIEEHASSSFERREGYLDALSSWGIEPDPNLMVTVSEIEAASKRAVARVLTEGRPSAIFACNDGTAFRAIEVCREMGLRVPEDVSVIGFDDIPVSVMSDPPLTTIRQPMFEIGAKAVEILCDQIDGRASTIHHILEPVQLIKRNSTMPVLQ
jgi:LacI family transcriptional regulator